LGDATDPSLTGGGGDSNKKRKRCYYGAIIITGGRVAQGEYRLERKKKAYTFVRWVIQKEFEFTNLEGVKGLR